MERRCIYVAFLLVCTSACASEAQNSSQATRLEASGAARPLQLQAYSGEIRAVVSMARSVQVPIVARLYGGGRPFSSRHVLISLTQLPGRHATTEAMQGSGNTYQAKLPITRKGWWEVAVRASDEDRGHVISFLLHVSSGPIVMGAYPLFSPVGRERVSVSLPLGREVAELQLAIGPIGSSILRIRVRPTHGLPPTRLHVRLTMLDMVMPTTTTVARRVAAPQYIAHPFVSMPGVWQVDVSDGQASATSVVVIGKPGALQSVL